MKAESIEQIREHLEKGGRVICEGSGRIVTGTSFCGERIILNSGHWVQFNSAHWQLLPLEEKEPVPVDHGTQKGQALDVTPDEMIVGAYVQRIRQRLLHGQWPDMSDLMAWWEATTGERIEMGKRCDACNCSGLAQEGRVRACEDCQGSGYSVRPTWMGDSK